MKSEKYLIISDIHNKVDKAQEIIDNIPHDKVIFLGDYFDSFHDNASDAYNTACWLKKSLMNPNHIFVYGNHDSPYRYSHDQGWIWCPGWDEYKQKRIKEVLTLDDWDKIKYYHRIGDWLFSHAGAHKRYFTHPIKGFSLDRVEEVCKEAKEHANMGLNHPLFRYGERMGMEGPGGIFWMDWEQFEPIENVNQVIGHSPDLLPRKKNEKNSQNYCLDTHLKHYGIFQDGKFDSYDVRTNKKVKL